MRQVVARLEAVRVAQRALRAEPQCHYAHHNLARFLRRRGEYKAAVVHARAAVAAVPEQGEYNVELAASLHSAGSCEEGWRFSSGS